MNGRKKESKYNKNIRRCVDTNENKNKFKRPQNERKKNDFHVCEIQVSSSFISGWFVEPRRCALVSIWKIWVALCCCLWEVFFFSLIHSEIFIHHSRFFSSFRSLNITNYNSHVYILQTNIHKHAGIINLCEF